MKGILIALSGAWLSGLAIPGIKLFLADVTPFNLIIVSNTGAILLIVVAKAIFSPKINHLSKKEWGWLGVGLFIGSGIAVPAVIYGMVTVSGSVAGLLFNLELFFTFYLAYFIFKEKLSKKSQGAMWIVFLGGIVGALGGHYSGSLNGILLIVFSCMMFALQTNILKKVVNLDSFSLAAIEFFASGVVAFVLGRIIGEALPAMDKIGGLMFLGALTYAFGNVLFYQSLRKIGAGKTATIFGASPLLGALSSLIILGDPVTPGIVFGLVLVGIGLILMGFEKHQKIEN